MPLLDALACACSLCTKEERRTLCRLAPAWRLPSLGRHGLRHEHLARYPCLDLSASSRACLVRPPLRKPCVVRPARLGPSQGSWVCVGEDGLCWAPFEPRCRPQAGKSGDPHFQNTDNSSRSQGVLGLGLAAKPKGKCGAPWAPKACGLDRRVAT